MTNINAIFIALSAAAKLCGAPKDSSLIKSSLN